MTPEHLGGAYECGDGNTWMPDCWGYLIVKYDIRSMLDIGCGFGHAMKWFSDFLVGARGIEGWDEAVEKNLMRGLVIKHDFTTGPVVLDREYDLAWSAEFLEHVEEKFIPNYMAAFQRCKRAVITHGEPGQHGHHHVNCQPDNYWVDVFAKWGFLHDTVETAVLRSTDRWRAGWGRRTLMLFYRQ